jgi:hypothetical protein
MATGQRQFVSAAVACCKAMYLPNFLNLVACPFTILMSNLEVAHPWVAGGNVANAIK